MSAIAIVTIMPTSYTNHFLIQARSYFLMTFEKSKQKNCRTSTSCVQDFLANLFQLPGKGEDLTTPEAQCFLKSQGFCKTKDRDILFSKMLKAYLITTEEKLSKQYLKFSPTLGIKLNGSYLILSSSEFLKTGKECTLLDVMEKNVSGKYFLSQKQVDKILAKTK